MSQIASAIFNIESKYEKWKSENFGHVYGYGVKEGTHEMLSIGDAIKKSYFAGAEQQLEEFFEIKKQLELLKIENEKFRNKILQIYSISKE